MKAEQRKRKQGRPPLLSEAVQKRLCRMLEAGSTINGACAILGVSSRSFRGWMQRGENGDEKFAGSFFAVTRAREIAKDKIGRSLVTEKDWRARAFVLERQFASEWGRTEARVIVIEREPQIARGIVKRSEETHWFKEPVPVTAYRSDGGNGAEEEEE